MFGQELNQSLAIELDSKSVRCTTKQEPVYLNIYNFYSCFNKSCECLGLGVYHTGIEVYGDEYIYFGFDGDETGIGYLQPRSAAYEFKQQLLLGYTECRLFQIENQVLDPLRTQFIGRQQLMQVVDTTSSILTATTFPKDSRRCYRQPFPSRSGSSPQLTSSTAAGAASPTASSTDDWTGSTSGRRRTSIRNCKKVCMCRSNMSMIVSTDMFSRDIYQRSSAELMFIIRLNYQKDRVVLLPPQVRIGSMLPFHPTSCAIYLSVSFSMRDLPLESKLKSYLFAFCAYFDVILSTISVNAFRSIFVLASSSQIVSNLLSDSSSTSKHPNNLRLSMT